MPVGGGDPINAVDINGLEDTAAVTGATVGAVAAGFTVNTVLARTALRGKLIYVKIDITCTAGLVATAANITDTTCFTLAAAYRPTEICSTIFSANAGTGEVQFNPDGTIVLRTADASIAAAGTIRMTNSYLTA